MNHLKLARLCERVKLACQRVRNVAREHRHKDLLARENLGAHRGEARTECRFLSEVRHDGRHARLLLLRTQDGAVLGELRRRRCEIAEHIDVCRTAVAERLRPHKAREIVRHGVGNDVLKRLSAAVADLFRVVEVAAGWEHIDGKLRRDVHPCDERFRLPLFPAAPEEMGEIETAWIFGDRAALTVFVHENRMIAFRDAGAYATR